MSRYMNLPDLQPRTIRVVRRFNVEALLGVGLVPDIKPVKIPLLRFVVVAVPAGGQQ